MVRLALCVAGIAAALAVGLAQSGDFPDPRREVRHIMPWGAGGATDTTMRALMQQVERALGVSVVTENIAGGLSSAGLLRVRLAPPDGYTIGTMTYDVLTLEAQGLAPLSWRDFAIVGMVTEHPSVLIVAAERWADLDAFRAAAGARAGAIKVGNVGVAGIWHQHAVALEDALGVRFLHVPYEAGSGAQLVALLGGEVDAIVASLPAALPHLREGTLRVLGVMSRERDPLVPGAPTFRELGLDLVFGGFRVVVAPKATPGPILARLEAAVHAAWSGAEFQEWSRTAAAGARWRDAAATAEYLEALGVRVGALMSDLGLR